MEPVCVQCDDYGCVAARVFVSALLFLSVTDLDARAGGHGYVLLLASVCRVAYSGARALCGSRREGFLGVAADFAAVSAVGVLAAHVLDGGRTAHVIGRGAVCVSAGAVFGEEAFALHAFCRRRMRLRHALERGRWLSL